MNRAKEAFNKEDGLRVNAKSQLDDALYALPTEILEQNQVLDTTAILQKAIKIAQDNLKKEEPD